MTRCTTSSRADIQPVEPDSHDYARAYAVCVEKTRRNIVRLADRPIAGAWASDGNYFENPEGFFAIGNWTSSFFTGMALLAFEQTGERHFLRQVNHLANVYRDKVTATAWIPCTTWASSTHCIRSESIGSPAISSIAGPD